MFDHTPETSVNSPRDLPPGDYQVTNSHFRHPVSGFEIIILSYELVMDTGQVDLVCINLIGYDANLEPIGIKEAVLVDGLWRNESGQTASNVTEFFPDQFLEFDLVHEETYELFTLTQRRKRINLINFYED